MCINPIQLKTNPDGLKVPCGRCTKCRARRASSWSFRLMQEEKRSISSHFITLTYATATVPINDSGYMDLSVRDLQLFFKRLRKLNNKIRGNEHPIRYYAAGEYGGKNSRPHYHIILFNAYPDDISRSWQQGEVHFGTVTGASIGYTLKYLSKQSKIPQHKNDTRHKEFSIMSKGIGSNYSDGLSKFRKWHLEDVPGRSYVNVGDGKKAAMSRYYKDKIYNDDQRRLIAARGASDSVAKASKIYSADPSSNGYRKKQIVIEYEKTIILQHKKHKL